MIRWERGDADKTILLILIMAVNLEGEVDPIGCGENKDKLPSIV
jgi:hypothetical protein